MTTSGTAQSGAPLLSSFQSAAPYGFSFRSCRLTLFRSDTVLCGLLLCARFRNGSAQSCATLSVLGWFDALLSARFDSAISRQTPQSL
nr:MAG TPA: hypothetical protein [Caudoviricetes sp.]